jgi:hypothetical protein
MAAVLDDERWLVAENPPLEPLRPESPSARPGPFEVPSPEWIPYSLSFLVFT